MAVIKIKLTKILILASLVCVAASERTNGNTLSAEALSSRSFSPDCLEWKISGVCIWLKCSIFGCRVVTTPRISHRLPDLMVAAYPHTKDSPLEGMSLILGLLGDAVDGIYLGGSITGIGNELVQHDTLQFNEVDVVGNPAANSKISSRFLCRSATKPSFPYYISLVDAVSWRSGLPDGLKDEALSPGKREIGNWPSHTWGSVYPRSGFLIQNHSGKAAAVSCQRAVDIVLRDGEGHVVKPFSKGKSNTVQRGDARARNEIECNQSGGYWQSGDLSRCMTQTWQQWLPESDERTDRWQLLLPTRSDRCETFGETEQWPHSTIAQDGKYIWNYWAKYKCCVKAGGVLLAHFEF